MVSARSIDFCAGHPLIQAADAGQSPRAEADPLICEGAGRRPDEVQDRQCSPTGRLSAINEGVHVFQDPKLTGQDLYDIALGWCARLVPPQWCARESQLPTSALGIDCDSFNIPSA